MTTLQTLMLIILFGFISCRSDKTETTINKEKLNIDSLSLEKSKAIKQNAISISDTIKKFKVDDYPVTNDMLADKMSNNSATIKKSGKIISHDKAWFGNDSLKQVLVFQLYTDYHRLVTYHFYNNDIPLDLINRIELHINGGELASEKQKLKDFAGFIKQITKIKSAYFISDKGFRLGDKKQVAINRYGQPDKQSTTNGIDKLEWEFVGDKFYDTKTDLKGKPLAKDSFGHQIVMYFKKGKLVGQILQNEIP